MKKSVLLALAALAFAGTSVAQEVTYVEDCSQGILMNRNKDNWFLTMQGGANMYFSAFDINAPIKDRIGGNAALYVGKWVTPTFGFRFGANYMMVKGATTADGEFRKMNVKDAYLDGYYPEKFQAIGPEFDVMINLTNWWCGYHPGRVYNAVLHGGAGAQWTFRRAYNDKDELKWLDAKDTRLFANVGLQNNFSLSKHFDLFIDVTYEIFDLPHLNHDLQLALGFNVNFGKSEWNCPVTAVCPTWKYTDAEGDALVARLANAENEINNLRKQLEDCDAENDFLKKNKGNCDAAMTVYYPINNATLGSREKQILNSMATVMNENPDQKWQLIGWADNFTGNNEINTNLRNRRVDGVKKYLLSRGVNEGQLEVGINDGDLYPSDNKGTAPLDRAVTIQKAK